MAILPGRPPYDREPSAQAVLAQGARSPSGGLPGLDVDALWAAHLEVLRAKRRGRPARGRATWPGETNRLHGTTPSGTSGRERSLTPVAAKMALASAGAIATIGVSPPPADGMSRQPRSLGRDCAGVLATEAAAGGRDDHPHTRLGTPSPYLYSGSPPRALRGDRGYRSRRPGSRPSVLVPATSYRGRTRSVGPRCPGVSDEKRPGACQSGGYPMIF